MADSPEALLAARRQRQHGAFTWQQALDCRIRSTTFRRAVARGRFRRLYDGVYLDPAFPTTPDQVAMAATLACNGHASHLTAGVVWELPVAPPAEPTVTVSIKRSPAPKGIDVRRTRRLLPHEAVTFKNIPITSPARTLVDIASLVDRRTLASCLDDLWRRKLVTPEGLVTYLADAWARGRPRSGVLRELCRERVGRRPPETDYESDLLEIIDGARLPLPDTQLEIRTPHGTYRVDLGYPAEKIAIEADGFDSRLHDAEAFRRDRQRQNLIEQQGWSFRRFSNAQIRDDPLSIVLTIGNALGLTPLRWKRR